MASSSTTRKSSITDTHDFECAECDFVSRGWETKTLRDARGRQHKAEHESVREGSPQAMPELADFLAEQKG